MTAVLEWWPALVAAAAAIVWAIRLEGKVAASATVVSLAQMAQRESVALATAIAVLQSTVTRLERETTNTAQIMDRLAVLETKVDAINDAEHRRALRAPD